MKITIRFCRDSRAPYDGFVFYSKQVANVWGGLKVDVQITVNILYGFGIFIKSTIPFPVMHARSASNTLCVSYSHKNRRARSSWARAFARTDVFVLRMCLTASSCAFDHRYWMLGLKSKPSKILIFHPWCCRKCCCQWKFYFNVLYRWKVFTKHLPVRHVVGCVHRSGHFHVIILDKNNRHRENGMYTCLITNHFD